MATYKTADGNTILADQAFIDIHYPGAVLIAETAPPALSLGTTITPLAFLGRFGSALAGLYQAAMVNPQIQIYRDKVLMSKAIDLSHPVTIASVNALVPNLLTQDQANGILNNPVTESEL